jgi:endonuclease/exonuclease/phosphatase family metal-dependent hydrolase
MKHQRFTKRSGWGVALLLMMGGLVAGCGEPPPAAAEEIAPEARLQAERIAGWGRGREVTVMTRNLYVGASLGPVIGAPTPQEIPGAVSLTLQKIQATNFPERAVALADEIEEHEPDLIGLQEVSLIRRQSPGDFFQGNPQPATEVVLDHLAILQAELSARGLRYVVAARQTTADVELPDAMGNDLRLTDAEVILVNERVSFSNVRSGLYAARVVVPAGGSGPLVEIPRGWVSIDARVAGRAFRFVSTHLEAEVAAIQVAQAAELVRLLAAEPLPVILLGDFNSAADGSTTPTYAMLTGQGGFTDAWPLGIDDDEGYTCCQTELLTNPTSVLRTRIDLVLFRDAPGCGPSGRLRVLDAALTGDTEEDRTPSGLWPSDHAGVVVTLRLQPRSS